MKSNRVIKYICLGLTIVICVLASACAKADNSPVPKTVDKPGNSTTTEVIDKPEWTTSEVTSSESIRKNIANISNINDISVDKVILLKLDDKDFHIVYTMYGMWLLEIKPGSSETNIQYVSNVKLECSNHRNEKVDDYTADGYPDILFFDILSGTGGTTTILNLYSIKDKILYTLTDDLADKYYDYPPPMAPNGELSKNPEMLKTCIRLMKDIADIEEFKVTEEELLTKPEYAPYQWVIDNRGVIDGKLTIRWYNFPLPFSNAATSEVEYNGIKFCAIFKDCIYGIDEKNNRFFVVYVPDFEFGEKHLAVNEYEKLLLIDDDGMEYILINLDDYSIKRNVQWEDIPGNDLLFEPTEPID